MCGRSTILRDDGTLIMARTGPKVKNVLDAERESRGSGDRVWAVVNPDASTFAFASGPLVAYSTVGFFLFGARMRNVPPASQCNPLFPPVFLRSSYDREGGENAARRLGRASLRGGKGG